MRRSLPIVFVLFAAFGFVQPAEALVITPSTTPQWTTNINSNLNTVDDFLAAFGFYPGDVLYKSEVGGSDSGPYAAAYNTLYSNTPAEPSDALIDYLGGFYMDCSVCYLLVKDGAQKPAQYLFDISGWDGNSDISVIGFWPDKGAISNVQILGTATRVPEPSTVALLGSGIAALYLRRRRATA